ncbi:MAG TPA: alpha-(1-_3)-arabinofuranosyltransferase family protein [Thermoleophilaceae bacterium]|nr:alpha-(1->3)-arabinofuranosyltransferase family protein [Thermoleophilaceae bacterium]
MTSLVRGRMSIPVGVAALGFALAFLQRPGEAYFDTRIELSTDPGAFLDRVANVWSSTGDLGHVQSGQFVGYLWPMGPWFALGDWLGVPMWVSQRLWLGLLLALAAWGVVALLDRIHTRERGMAHLVAALLYMLSPYVVIYASRGSFTLLGYAALPWLLVIAHRGLHEPRGWLWPAAFALAVTSTGGGVNAAVLFWVLAAPAVLLVYEVVALRTPRRPALGFALRAAVCTAAVSLWWVVPVLIQALYGADFLAFTEAPGTIWGTTSMAESLRGLGFWVVYLGVGFGQIEPAMDVAAAYLFEPAVVIATFAVPLAAIAGLRSNWPRPYVPFLALLAFAGLVAMFAGYPEGAPLRRALHETYDQVEALRFLRTTYKAAPLLVLATATLAGIAAADVWRRLAGARRARLLVPAAAAAVIVLAGLPLFTGRAIDDELSYDEVPSYWRAAIADAEAATREGERIAVLPGELFAIYRWGETNDSIVPAIADRPVMERTVVRYADPRASQLLAGIDDLIQQGRAVPGQLAPLLELTGVGDVLVATDGRGVQSGTTGPALAAAALERAGGFEAPRARWGDVREFGATAGRTAAGAALPAVRAYEPPRAPLGLVRVKGEETIVDGDADGLVALAATGELRPDDAIFYAGDLERDELRAMLERGAALVLTDSARRRLIAPSRVRTNRGPTLTAADELTPQMPFYDIFSEHGTAAQTLAEYEGLRYLRAPHSAGLELFPETRPYAAFDGRLETSWIADENLAEDEQYVELALPRPHRADAIRVLPHADPEGRTQAVGVSVDGGGERVYPLARGWSTVPIPGGELSSLRIYARGGEGADEDERADALAEVEIPGLAIEERLRLPTVATRAAAGLSLAGNDVAVVLERTTADFPFRAGADRGTPLDGNPVHARDAEPGIERSLELPVARRYAVDGWASVRPDADDAQIDRLAGVAPGFTMSSSSRFEGVPGRRASSAFDRDPATYWAGDTEPGARPWIRVEAPTAFELRALRLLPGPDEFPAPARVRVRAGGLDVTRAVPPSGGIRLPRPVRTRSIRVDVVEAAPARRDQGLAAVAIGEVEVPGLRPPVPRRSGPVRTGCDALRVETGGVTAGVRVRGTLGSLDAGEPLALAGCGELALPAGRVALSAPPGAVMRPDHLRLRSPAQRPAAGPAAGAVLDQGSGSGGEREGARLDAPAGTWLVLGEGYSEGWRAECRGPDGETFDLGEPVPIDGFANGWRLARACAHADFAFAPQRAADLSYAFSAVGLAAVLALLLVSLRRPRRARAPELRAARPADPVLRPALPGAVAAALAVGAVSAALFALRSGPVAALAAFALLRWGVSVRRLAGLAAVGAAALPVLYLAFPAEDKGGYSFEFASDTMGAHWVADGVVLLMGAAALLAAVAIRRVRASSRG